MTWHDLNEIETQLYELKALVNVSTDAMGNEICHPDSESVQTVFSIMSNKIRVLEDYVPKMFELYRGYKIPDPASKWDADGEVGLPVEDEDGEDYGDEVDEEEAEAAEASDAGRFTRSSFVGGLEAVLKEEHDDGSATYTITADDDTLKRLFEAFFIRAVIEGLKSVEGKNEEFVSLKKAATDLERVLQVWENSDVLDYDPDVKDRREALTKALYG
jgi:hypothetical protein